MPLILGIDPGSRKTGFGVIDARPAKPLYVASGVIRIPEISHPERLAVIFQHLRELIEHYQPDEVAVEEVFMHKSAGSALKLGQARGAAIVACTSLGLPVAEYAARLIKQAVVGNGGAGKTQVQQMVMHLLRLPAAPQEDAADALACALCHAHSRLLTQRLGVARGTLKSSR